MQRLITEREAAELLGVSVQLLRKWRSQPNPPLPHIQISRCVRYRPEDLEAYVANCSVIGEGTQNGGAPE